MATAHVIPPEPGWGAVRVLMVTLERLGYRVDEARGPGRYDVRLLLR